MDRLVILFKYVLFCCVFGLLTNAYALGEAEFEFIGFSEDGSYLAFEQYGIQDGSGFAFSEIYVVDVDNNSYVVAPFVLSSQDDEQGLHSISTTRTSNRSAAQPALSVYNIISGNIGQQVVNRLRTDIFADSRNVYFPKNLVSVLYRYKADDSDYSENNDYYQLSLGTQAVVTDNCEFNAPFGHPEPVLFTLMLRDAENQSLQVLQEDTVLFDSRNCAFEYVIREVYMYQRSHGGAQINKLAVFLNSFEVGFEGPDSKWLVVTGAIDSIE